MLKSVMAGKLPQTFLIFGSRGFVGSYVLKYLKAEVDEKNIFTTEERLQPSNYDAIDAVVQRHSHIICSVGRTRGNGINNIDYLESHLQENIRDNLYSQLMLAQICQKHGKHLTCVNTGCIYTSAKVGQTELDVPDFFGSSYSIVKSYLDQLLNRMDNVLNLRIKMPITDDDSGSSLVNKLLKYKKITDIQNSMCYVPDIFPMAVRLIMSGATGCYNTVNSGSVANKEIVDMYIATVNPDHEYEVDPQDPSNRSNSVLSNKKLESDLNVRVRDIRDALAELFSGMATNPI